MKAVIALIAMLLYLCACHGAEQSQSGTRTDVGALSVDTDGVTGTLHTLPQLSSKHVASRQVDVWLPPGYDTDTQTDIARSRPRGAYRLV